MASQREARHGWCFFMYPCRIAVILKDEHKNLFEQWFPGAVFRKLLIAGRCSRKCRKLPEGINHSKVKKHVRSVGKSDDDDFRNDLTTAGGWKNAQNMFLWRATFVVIVNYRKTIQPARSSSRIVLLCSKLGLFKEIFMNEFLDQCLTLVDFSNSMLKVFAEI
jgi:hypothetical protein